MVSVLSKLIRRPPGSGWIVLHGGEPLEINIQRTLALTQHAGTIFTITYSPQTLPSVENAHAIWQDITGWSGRVRAVSTLDDVGGWREEIGEATLVLFPETDQPAALADAIQSADLLEPLAEALDDGALLVACGGAASLFADWMAQPDGSVAPGLGWIPSSVIQPHFLPQMPCSILAKRPGLFRLGIPDDAAMTLGPNEERDFWGDTKPTLTFGIGWDR
jgi:hypothetical protein